MSLPAKAKDTESPGVFVYAEEPPQKSVTLFVVHDPVYFNVELLSSTVVFVSVALSSRLVDTRDIACRATHPSAPTGIPPTTI